MARLQANSAKTKMLVCLCTESLLSLLRDTLCDYELRDVVKKCFNDHNAEQNCASLCRGMHTKI